MDKTIDDPRTLEEAIHENSKKLLNIARKQLQPEIYKEIEKAYKNQDNVVYKKGYGRGYVDALQKNNLVDIDKAYEWLENNVRNYYSAYTTENKLIEDFKQAMK